MNKLEFRIHEREMRSREEHHKSIQDMNMSHRNLFSKKKELEAQTEGQKQEVKSFVKQKKQIERERENFGTETQFFKGY